MVRLLAIVIAFGLVIGLILPDGKPGTAPAAATPGPRIVARARPESRAATAGLGGETVLQREADGHFYADVRVNGMAIRFLVDTGASGIALSREDAQRAGVLMSYGPGDVVGQGAAGAVHGQFVTLDRVELGSASSQNHRAAVLEGARLSLLGQDFLARFSSVEMRGDTMVLR